MSARGAGLYQERFGAGPDLVMVHGWAMHSGLWRDFALKLAAHFRVTLIDLPGHGRSGGMTSFALDEVTDRLLVAAPQPAHWLGWSLGGLFALRAAHRQSQAVSSVILMAATPRFTAAGHWPGVDANVLDGMSADFKRDFPATLKRFIALQTFGQDSARSLARQIEASVHEAPSPESEAVRAGLEVLRESDLRQDLSELPQPLLAILGGRDRLVPKSLAGALGEIRPDFSVCELPGAAHLPFLTHQTETLETILTFTGSLSSSC